MENVGNQCTDNSLCVDSTVRGVEQDPAKLEGENPDW